MSVQDEAKKAAGRRIIADFVKDGMKLGLGSGTTSHFFVRELGKHVARARSGRKAEGHRHKFTRHAESRSEFGLAAI